MTTPFDRSTGNLRGQIFNNLGYSLAITQEHATIWRYSQERDAGHILKPLTIQLPHPSSSARQPLPFGLLLPSSGDLALLLVAPTSGKITYWESVSLAANSDSKRQRQHCVQGVVNGLMSGEVVTNVTEGEPNGFVLTLSSGRVAHMAINDPQGKASITVQFMRNDAAQNGGLFGSLRSVFSTSGWKRDIAVVRPGLSVHRGQRQVVVATTKGVFQIWDLNWNGTQSMIVEIDGKGQFLKALAEGGDIFHDRYDHHFEVLDFTFQPKEFSSDAVAQPPSKGNCSLYVLTVLHGTDESKYNILGLTISSGALTVDIIHPISCYTSPLSSTAKFRPQINVPEPGMTAFVIFEKSIVLVSLGQIKLSANDQLLLESGNYQDPFQDTIEFKKYKDYTTVACASEAAEADESPVSCTVFVGGFGMVRVTAMPMPKNEIADHRVTVTAKTKIEQAIFFGNLPQDLLDFSGRPEIRFSKEQIESAAKEISLSIIQNTSPYIPKVMPILEHQLQRRELALSDLMKHLKQRYEPLSRATRWELLCDAEKLAAAIALWRANQDVEHKVGRHKMLFEAVEMCPEYLKHENREDLHETDPVRHWFAHDVWRIEEILPYILETPRMMREEYEEASEKYGPVTPAVYLGWLNEVIDLYLAALQTAFAFREFSANLYGFGTESMVDGILVEGFEDTPEPWTSRGDFVERMEAMVGDTIQSYEDNKMDGDVDEPDQELKELLDSLQAKIPEQIQVWSQVRIERLRWLKSRGDQRSVKEGDGHQQHYFAMRLKFFTALYNVVDDLAGAVQLAEKYGDMAALVDIKDLERGLLVADLRNPRVDKTKSSTALKNFDKEIQHYFTTYGTVWSDVYFKKHLNNKQIASVLDQSTIYQQSLTQFLRRHSEYSKLRWINEAYAERNFLAAAESLQQAQADEDLLWSKKVELSMWKLTLLAACEQTHMKDDLAKQRIKVVDAKVANTKIQEQLYDYIRFTLRSALNDDDTRIGIVQETHLSGLIRKQPYLLSRIKRNLKRLVAQEVLDGEDLIDNLTLMKGAGEHDDYNEHVGTIDKRFYLALKVLGNLDYQKSEPARHDLWEKIIWRRCVIDSDWTAINRTEDKTEDEVRAEIVETAAFTTLKATFANSMYNPSLDTSPTFCSWPCWLTHLDPPFIDPPAPSPLMDAGTSLESLRTSSRYATHADADLTRLAKDMQRESHALDERIEKGRLEERWQGIVEAARESVKQDREAELERTRVRREKEAESESRIGVGEITGPKDIGW